MKLTFETIQAIYNGYITCALWSTMDENDIPLDENYDEDNLDWSVVATSLKDIISLLETLQDKHLLEKYPGTAEQLGHDFWLTRNGHGAGFWDRDYGEIGDILTEYADAYGEVYLYTIEETDTIYLT